MNTIPYQLLYDVHKSMYDVYCMTYSTVCPINYWHCLKLGTTTSTFFTEAFFCWLQGNYLLLKTVDSNFYKRSRILFTKFFLHPENKKFIKENSLWDKMHFNLG